MRWQTMPGYADEQHYLPLANPGGLCGIGVLDVSCNLKVPGAFDRRQPRFAVLRSVRNRDEGDEPRNVRILASPHDRVEVGHIRPSKDQTSNTNVHRRSV